MSESTGDMQNRIVAPPVLVFPVFPVFLIRSNRTAAMVNGSTAIKAGTGRYWKRIVDPVTPGTTDRKTIRVLADATGPFAVCLKNCSRSIL
jgi:hypothetical protein